ncbi:hypothetical protein D3C75_1268400 [compost metagenome]
MGISHIAFNFRFRHQCRYGVHDDNVYCATADERFGDFQCLFACIRLGEQQLINVYAESISILRVKRMLCIDESSLSTKLLHFCNRM